LKNSFGGQNGAGIGIRKTLAKVLQTVLRAFWRDSIFHFATCLTYFNKLLALRSGFLGSLILLVALSVLLLLAGLLLFALLLGWVALLRL
jgi:hypothetical protein